MCKAFSSRYILRLGEWLSNFNHWDCLVRRFHLKQAKSTRETRVTREVLVGSGFGDLVIRKKRVYWTLSQVNSAAARFIARSFKIIFFFFSLSAAGSVRADSGCTVQSAALRPTPTAATDNVSTIYRCRVLILNQLLNVWWLVAVFCACLQRPVTLFCWWQFPFCPQSGTVHWQWRASR